MIEEDGSDGRIPSEIVLVRSIIAVPSDDIERRMVDSRGPQRPSPFHVHSGRRVLILVGGDRRQEIALIGKTIGSDRPALGEREGPAVVLAHVAASRPAREFDPDLHPARNDRDLAGLYFDDPELGAKAKVSLLRCEEHFPVPLVEVPHLISLSYHITGRPL